ncbi:MAG: DNA-binding response regulator [Anaerolineae bacterium]|nr:MAG: DNA-binding response regulator [Anaerolineae bacterium]
MITVLLVDNHPLFRDGVARLLSDAPGIALSGATGNAADALELARRHKPDILILDVYLPGISGIELGRKIRDFNKETQCLFLTDSDNPADLFAALRCGGRGYLLKDTTSQTLIEAIHQMHSGGVVIHPKMAAVLVDEFNLLTKYAQQRRAAKNQAEDSSLTEREIEVLRLVARGLSNREIGEKLDISPHTVKTHLSHLMEKLQINSRVEATAWAIRHGLLKED